MKFVDLFCGIGGSSYGAVAAGLEPLLLVDNDPKCRDALDKSLRDFFVQCDLGKRSEKLLSKLHGLDVLLCSPPCQNYSTMKTRNGRDLATDEDAAFISYILEICGELVPSVVVVENSPRFLKSKLCSDLVAGFLKRGYSITASVIDAAEMGVPQRRKRSIITASRKRHRIHKSQGHMTVRSAFSGLPPLGSVDPLHQSKRRHSDEVMRRIKSIPKNGGSRTALPDDLQLECHKRSNGYRDVYGRMAWDKPAPTITGGCTNPSKGRFIHPEEHRAITLREAARLQTLPDTVFLQQIRSQETRAKLIGNAFPPDFINQILHQLVG